MLARRRVRAPPKRLGRWRALAGQTRLQPALRPALARRAAMAPPSAALAAASATTAPSNFNSTCQMGEFLPNDINSHRYKERSRGRERDEAMKPTWPQGSRLLLNRYLAGSGALS